MTEPATAYENTPEDLFRAIHAKDKDAVNEILIDEPALARVQWRKRSMLMHAVQEAAPATMSDKENVDKQHGYIKAILQLLLEYGADPEEPPPGPHPETLLHLAARTGAKSAVEVLPRKKADLEKRGGKKDDTALLAAIDGLVTLPCIVNDELKPPPRRANSLATITARDAAWNAQAKNRNIAQSYLDCIKSLSLHSDANATVRQCLGTPVHGVPSGAEVNANALWLLVDACSKSLWLKSNEQSYAIWLRFIDLARHADVNAHLTLAADPSTSIGDSLLQHALRTGLGEGAFYTLLWNGADQSVAHPLHPEYSVRDYYRLYAAADDELKKTYDKMLTWDRGSFQLGSNGIWDTLLHYGNKGSYTDLPNQTKRLAEFGGLHRVFESPITEYFKREEECLQVAQLLEALLPAHLKGATGPYTMRHAPLAQPETSATVAYLHGATAEVKR